MQTQGPCLPRFCRGLEPCACILERSKIESYGGPIVMRPSYCKIMQVAPRSYERERRDTHSHRHTDTNTQTHRHTDTQTHRHTDTDADTARYRKIP